MKWLLTVLLMASPVWAEPLDLSKGHIPFLFQLNPQSSQIQYISAGTFNGGTITTGIFINLTGTSPSSGLAMGAVGDGFWTDGSGNVHVAALNGATTSTMSWNATQSLVASGTAALPSLGGISFATSGLYIAAGPTVGTTNTGAARTVSCESKSMGTSSGSPTTLITISIPTTLTGISGTFFYGTVAANATQVDDDSGAVGFTAENLSGTLTVHMGTPGITDASGILGSVASTPSISATSTTVNLILSPTYTTIVPTSTASDVSVIVHGAVVAPVCQ